MDTTTPSISPSSTNAIGVIVCSSRKPRACPQIAEFVISTLKDSLLQQNGLTTNTATTFHLIDLAEWNLPMYDEPVVPSQVKDHLGYANKHTQQWSLEIQKYNALVFVTPQYNWGYPAVIKNAIDYLYHEWNGKAAMIVTYGGHGGGKAAVQLRQVLEGGLHMSVAETMPTLSFPSKAVLFTAATGGKLNLSGDDSIWVSERPVIIKAFGEVMTILQSN